MGPIIKHDTSWRRTASVSIASNTHPPLTPCHKTHPTPDPTAATVCCCRTFRFCQLKGRINLWNNKFLRLRSRSKLEGFRGRRHDRQVSSRQGRRWRPIWRRWRRGVKPKWGLRAINQLWGCPGWWLTWIHSAAVVIGRDLIGEAVVSRQFYETLSLLRLMLI